MPSLVVRVPTFRFVLVGYQILDGGYNYEFYTSWAQVHMPTDRRYFAEIFGADLPRVDLDIVFVERPYRLAYAGRLCSNVVVRRVETNVRVATAADGRRHRGVALEVYEADTGRLCGIVLQSVVSWPFDRVVYASPCIPNANVCFWYNGPYDVPFSIPSRIRPYKVEWISLNIPSHTCCVDPHPYVGVEGNFWAIKTGYLTGAMLVRLGPDIFITYNIPPEIYFGELF